MAALDENDIIVQPEAMDFLESDTSEQLICIENWCEVDAVFRVHISIPNLFILGESAGIVDSSTAVEFPVSLKGVLPPDFDLAHEISATLHLQFSPLTEEYDSDGVRAFWAMHEKIAMKKDITCIVRKNGTAESSRTSSLLWQSSSLGTFADSEEGAAESASPPPAAVSRADVPLAVTKADIPSISPITAAVVLPAVAQSSIPSPRRSVADVPGTKSSVFDDLIEKQTQLEKEHLDGLDMMPDDGFKNVIDELRRFSMVLNQSMEIVSEVTQGENVDALQAQAKHHAEEIVEKDAQIGELNAEIRRLIAQYDDDCTFMQERNVARITAIEKQHETKLASVMAHHEAQLKQSADEQASRTAALTKHYESRIAAMAKQQEEMGGQEELLEQQRVMMEALTEVKDNEMEEAIKRERQRFELILQERDYRIEELSTSVDLLKLSKRDEVGSLTKTHSMRVQSLTRQQASAIGTLSSQMESTLKVYRDRAEALEKQVSDLQQERESGEKLLRQKYDNKLLEYTTFCTKATNEMQSELAETKQKLQKAELKLAMMNVPTGHPEEMQRTAIASAADIPSRSKEPLLRETLLRPKLTSQTTVRKLVPRNRPIPPTRRTTAADCVVVTTTQLKFAAGTEVSEDRIVIRNQGVFPVAYKLFANKKNMFTLAESTGVLLGGELKLLSIIKKASVQAVTTTEIQSAKFKISLVAAGEDFNILPAREFWTNYKDSVVEKVVISDAKL